MGAWGARPRTCYPPPIFELGDSALNVRTSAIAVAGVALVAVLCGVQFGLRPVQADELPQLPAIGFLDTVKCRIDQSWGNGVRENFFYLTGLKTDSPKAIFEGGSSSPLTVAFNDNHTLTLLLVASASGSVDAIVIDKATGQFARSAAGSLLGLYSSSQLGTCK
jgi:hypothetical protein